MKLIFLLNNVEFHLCGDQPGNSTTIPHNINFGGQVINLRRIGGQHEYNLDYRPASNDYQCKLPFMF